MIQPINHRLNAELNCIAQQLQIKLSIDNIFKEYSIVASLNKRLQIKLSALIGIDLLKFRSIGESIEILKRVNLLKQIGDVKGESNDKIYQLKYADINRILLVTGIGGDKIKQFIREFAQKSRKWALSQGMQTPFAALQSNNGFWSNIKTCHPEYADQLKAFLRNKKKIGQTNSLIDYKPDTRRIRIVCLNDRDLLSLILDAMSEHKANIFTQSLTGSLNGQKKMNNPSKIKITQREEIIYHPIISNYLGNINFQQMHYEQAVAFNQAAQNLKAIMFNDWYRPLKKVTNGVKILKKDQGIETEPQNKVNIDVEKEVDKITTSDNANNKEEFTQKEEACKNSDWSVQQKLMKTNDCIDRGQKQIIVYCNTEDIIDKTMLSQKEISNILNQTEILNMKEQTKSKEKLNNSCYQSNLQQQQSIDSMKLTQPI